MEESRTKTNALYIDANDLEYPIEVGGFKCSSAETLLMGLDMEGLLPEDAIKVQIKSTKAILGKGDPVVNTDDVIYAHFDANGTVVLRGNGG